MGNKRCLRATHGGMHLWSQPSGVRVRIPSLKETKTVCYPSFLPVLGENSGPWACSVSVLLLRSLFFFQITKSRISDGKMIQPRYIRAQSRLREPSNVKVKYLKSEMLPLCCVTVVMEKQGPTGNKARTH